VLEVSEGVEEFAPGDRVACIGNGLAQHTNYAVVPHNLCVLLPDGVTFAQGAYAMLAATGLHAVRRGQPELGEYVLVIGLGLVGQLTAQLYQLAGTYVMGWDKIPFCTEIAQRWGIDATAVVGVEDEIAATKAFTRGQGLDAAVFAFGGDGNQALESTRACLKCAPDGHPYGRIVVVGLSHFNWAPGFPMTNIDIRQASRTGPGYHDDHWETGPGYPPVFMRWTTRTHLELCMRLIAEGKLNVDALTTHIVPLHDVDAAILAIIGEPDKILGVVFEMHHP
jgi:threonine dehydrogenase-like Zn-dependent dehydrogenase